MNIILHYKYYITLQITLHTTIVITIFVNALNILEPKIYKASLVSRVYRVGPILGVAAAGKELLACYHSVG